jgi:hypothetical protein
MHLSRLFLIGISNSNLRSNTVRPPDENQHGSTRPNLLSGARRRFQGDDNILERLERDSARHASGNRSRAAWYAAAASLVLLLLVVVAWTAIDNASTVHVMPVTRIPAETGPAVVTTVAPDPVPTPPVPSVQPALPVAPPEPVPASTASRSGATVSLPPLVLLPEHESAPKPAAPAKPGPPLPAPVVRTASAVRSGATAQQQAAPARAAPRATAAAARPRPPATGPRPNHPPVDRDVALLSAIIIHDSAHADEKAQLEAAAACARVTRRCPLDTGKGSRSKN